MTRNILVLPLVMSILVLSPSGILAQEGDPAPEAAAVEPAWSASAGLSYLATSGNSDSSSLGLDLEATRRPLPWGLEFKAQVQRADESGATTVERYQAGLRGTRTLTERWHAFAGLSAEQDEFAGIDLRSIVEAGAAYKALLGPRHILNLDFALTWTDEKRLAPGADASSLGGLIGASYVLALSDNASFSQDLRYFANFDDTGDWRLDSLTAVTAALSQRLALRFSHEIRYRNQPIGNNDDSDTTTKASLVVHL